MGGMNVHGYYIWTLKILPIFSFKNPRRFEYSKKRLKSHMCYKKKRMHHGGEGLYRLVCFQYSSPAPATHSSPAPATHSSPAPATHSPAARAAGLRLYMIQLYTVIILHKQLHGPLLHAHNGKTQHATIRHATTRHITIRHDTFRHSKTRYFTTRSGKTWHAPSRHVTTRHDKTRHAIIGYDTIQHATTRHAIIRHTYNWTRHNST